MKNIINKKSSVLAIISVIMSLSLVACGSNDNKNTANNTTQSSVEKKSVEKTNNNENNKNENSTEKQNNNKKVAQNTINVPKFIKNELGSNIKPEFATNWKSSQDNNFSVCIDGKGSEASEEGTGKILIKDKEGKIVSFEPENKKIAPKFIDWADKQNILIILGSSHGTLAKGGNLYLMNANTGKVYSVFESSDKKQQVVSVKKSNNNLSLKVNVFDDDNFDKSHMEDWSIGSFDTTMNKSMEIKDSNGNVKYNIN